MKHTYGDKYSIAWFSLAQIVARKEKERALGIYRLLVHSLSDQAVIAQLEGDLLLSFNDDRALECYLKAAHIYEQDLRIAQAAAMYEHILLLNPYHVPHISSLLMLYLRLKNEAKIFTYATLLVHQLSIQQAYTDLEALFGTLSSHLNPLYRAELYSATFFILLEQLAAENQEHEALLSTYLTKALNALTDTENSKQLQQFLAKLALVNTLYHEQALALLAR